MKNLEEILIVKNTDEKVDLLENFIKFEAKNVDAILALSNLYSKKSFNLKRWNLLENAIKLMPKNVKLKNALGRIAFKNNNIKEAEKLFREVLKIAKNNWVSNLKLGEIFVKKKKYNRALNHFKIAHKNNKQAINPQIQLIIEFNRRKEFDKSKKILDKLIVTHPNEFLTHLQFALLQKKLGKHKEAFQLFDKAKQFGNYNQKTNADFAKVNLLVETDKLKEAMILINDIEKNNSSNKFKFLKAKIYSLQLKVEEAAKVYDSIIKNDAKNEQAIFEVSKCYKQQGNLKKAEESILKRIKLNQNYVPAKMFYANLLEEKADYKKAILIYKEILGKNEKHISANCKLATMLNKIGEQNEALNLLLNYENLYGKNATIYIKLAQIFESENKYKEVLKYNKLAFQLNENDSFSFIAYVRSLMNYSNINKAIELVNIRKQKFKNEFKVDLLEINLLKRKGKFTKCVSNYKSLIKKHPSKTIDLQLKLAQVYNLKGYFNNSANILKPIKSQHIGINLSKNITLYQSLIPQYKLISAEKYIKEAIKFSSNPITHQLKLVYKYLLNYQFDELYKTLKSATSLLEEKIANTKTAIPFKVLVSKIYYDLKSNPKIFKQIETFGKKNGEEKIKELSKIIESNENYFGAHLLLVKELRVNKKIENFNKAVLKHKTIKNKIPKTIIQYWDNPKIPVEVINCCKTWMHKNKNFEYKIFNYKTVLDFLQTNYGKEEITAFKNCSNAAMQADFFRLCYLKKFGGIYADADDMCLNSIDKLVDKNANIYFYQEDVMSIANNFIATIPNHKIIETAFNLVKQNLLNYNKESAWFKTGPANFTMSYAKYILTFLKENNKLSNDVYIFGYADIRKFIYQFVPMAYKKTNKNWNTEASKGKVNYVKK